MKNRVKKCLICFKNTSLGSKNCEHCGFKFKSSRKRNWQCKLKDFVSRVFQFGV